MARKKNSPPTSSMAVLRDELEYLYLRRFLVENLIHALEMYTLLADGYRGSNRIVQ
jgi:hypothetical protein